MEHAADHIRLEGDPDVECLVSLLQHAEDQENNSQHQGPKPGYDCDEDDYDQLFMDLISSMNLVKGQSRRVLKTVLEQDQEMDTSLG